MADKKPDTQLVSAGRNKKYTLGAVNSMTQRVSSLVSDNVEAKKHVTHNRTSDELFYGRRRTLTHSSLQQVMYELEGDAGCVLFPCGAAVVASSILALIEQGDYVSMTDTVYEPSRDSCSKILSKLGITTSWFDPPIGANIAKHLQPNTKIVFLESPGSITMKVHDIPTIVAIVRSAVPDAITMIDNTWAAGVLLRALDFGIDVSTQVATKYLAGHSDATIGTMVCNTRCQEQLQENACLMGQMVDADTAYIASHDLRILGMRLRQHHESSLKMAEQPAEHPQVVQVSHPAPPGSKGCELWKRDFTGNSGLLSFVLKKKLNDEELANYLGSFSLFNMVYSWGGYELLILASQPEHIAAIRPRGKIDFNGTPIRLYIGLEDVDDLIVGLDAGFA